MLRALVALTCCIAWAGPVSQADVTGRWRVTITGSGGSVVGAASLEQSGEKVTGWMGPSEQDATPLSGVVKGEKLTLKLHPKPGFAVPFDTCELTIRADRMTGSVEMDGGSRSTIEFERARSDK